MTVKSKGWINIHAYNSEKSVVEQARKFNVRNQEIDLKRFKKSNKRTRKKNLWGSNEVE